ncbi:hypothetical protein SUGI_0490070 [Cryptomeria japonica]|nr:hypothetical protein SUGI_0490070 [Cryptomeria japonica]
MALGALVSARLTNANVFSSSAPRKTFVVSTPSEPRKIAMYSPAFFAACAMGGILSCGLTHTGVPFLILSNVICS